MQWQWSSIALFEAYCCTWC